MNLMVFFLADSFSSVSNKCGDSVNKRNAAIVVLLNSYLVDKK